jgi:hypothetical protein
MTPIIQKLIDIAFYCENRFDDHKIVQVTVAEFAEFARSYLALRGALENAMNDTRQRILDAENALSAIEKLLKGEV